MGQRSGMSPDGRACEDSLMPDSQQGPTWEFDELSHAGQEHLDATYIAGYNQKSPTDWTEDVASSKRWGSVHLARS